MKIGTFVIERDVKRTPGGGLAWKDPWCSSCGGYRTLAVWVGDRFTGTVSVEACGLCRGSGWRPPVPLERWK